jgi:predicted lipid-binding transport protein (Tim44 family)
MRARQVVYRGRWWGGLARAMVVGTIYLMLMGFAILGLLVAAIMLR